MPYIYVYFLQNWQPFYLLLQLAGIVAVEALDGPKIEFVPSRKVCKEEYENTASVIIYVTQFDLTRSFKKERRTSEICGGINQDNT